ncbi:MAG: GNAT family N-acetyltransferase [Oscillospiraceae bacterium]|nr:GNAT family N-acetyltransferase [Oscillospiraceae bacterium]
MRQIIDYTEISKSVMAHMKKGVLTNNFMHPDEYRAEISAGTLFAYEYGGGLLLFRKREGRHLLTFYINDRAVLPDIKLPPDTVLSMPLKAVGADAVSYWIRFGMHPLGEYIRLTRVAGSALVVGDSTVQIAVESDFDSVHTLLRDSFDLRTGCLPSTAELRGDIKRGMVLCVKDNGIGGVLRFAEFSGRAEIMHLAVHEDLRGRGIGHTLVSGFAARYGKQKCTVWMRDGYTPALKTYTAAGFSPDGQISVLFGFTNEEK